MKEVRLMAEIRVDTSKIDEEIKQILLHVENLEKEMEAIKSGKGGFVRIIES